MLRDMQIHFSPIISIITKTVMYKKGILIPFSTGISISLTTVNNFFNTDFLGVSISFLVLASILFCIDYWTGVKASKYEREKALKNGDKKLAEEKKFKSSKINFTFFKFLTLFLWIWLAERIGDKIKNIHFIEELYSIITIIPLTLVVLREYVSIGENIERKYNNKPYIFKLVDSIFNYVESIFYKKTQVKKDED